VRFLAQVNEGRRVRHRLAGGAGLLYFSAVPHVKVPGRGSCEHFKTTPGCLMGKFNQSGIDAEFRDRVQHLVEPDHSAVVIMASKITEDKFASAMQPFGGTILKTSLSESDEKELAEELTG